MSIAHIMKRYTNVLFIYFAYSLYYSRPRCRETVMFWSCYFFFFSVHRFLDVPGPAFAKLCHTTRYVLKYFISYTGVHTWPLKNFRGENPQFSPICRPKIDTLSPAIPNAGKIGKSKTIVNIWLGEDVHTKHGGGTPPTSEIGCSLVYIWGGTGEL